MAKRQLADLVGEEIARPAPVVAVQAEPLAPAVPPPAVPLSTAPEPQPVQPKQPAVKSPAGGAARTHKTSSPSVRLKSPPALPMDERDEELAELPKYLRLVRKEARLREEQVLDLDRLVLRLNRRRRTGEGERITLNTLLRIGADLVLERQAELSGDTEDDLSRSLHR